MEALGPEASRATTLALHPGRLAKLHLPAPGHQAAAYQHLRHRAGESRGGNRPSVGGAVRRTSGLLGAVRACARGCMLRPALAPRTRPLVPNVPRACVREVSLRIARVHARELSRLHQGCGAAPWDAAQGCIKGTRSISAGIAPARARHSLPTSLRCVRRSCQFHILSVHKKGRRNRVSAPSARACAYVVDEKQREKKVMSVSPGRFMDVPNKTTQVVKDAIATACARHLRPTSRARARRCYADHR
jgi:hypothetical protein